MGKMRVRYQYGQTGATLKVSIERMMDGAQYNFTTGDFQPVVQDQDALLPLVERTPANYHGLSRYRQMYCVDLPIDPTKWVDGDYLVCA